MHFENVKEKLSPPLLLFVFHKIVRAQFKYTLKQCRLEELAVNRSKLANYIQNREINAFWKECKNTYYFKA